MAKLEQISRNGKKGYKALGGTIVIEPQYDDCVGTFGLDSYNHTEYAIVAIDGKCGMINESGETVIPLEYQEVKHLFEDLFAARKETKDKSWCIGVVKPNGEIVIPFDYKYIVAKGKYIVCFKEACSSRVYTHTLIDTNGCVYKYVRESNPVVFNCNGQQIYEGEAVSSKFDYLITKQEDRFGVIDMAGNSILENKYDAIDIACKDRFIVRINDEESWSFGVLNDKAEIIIDFKYKYIASDKGWFFECYKECLSTKEYGKDNSNPYEYNNKTQECWLNPKGKLIYSGDAKVLSEELIACMRDGKTAVYSVNGKRIVNFQYDRVCLMDNYIVVEKDGKVGVLTDSGVVVIDALYENIEFVHIDDSIAPYYTEYLQRSGDVYGCFSKDNVFDTDSKKDRLNRQMIRFVKSSGITRYTGIRHPGAHYSFQDVMILRTSDYAELFSLEEGIINNSRYDTVQQLTDLSYVVSSKGKYGVFRRDVHSLIIPCEYDRIIFEGNHVVLLNKDGLWGAKSLVLPKHPLYPLTKADVPVKFKEISILDSIESLFGVKQIRVNYYKEEIEEYTIVDCNGEEYEKMDEFTELSSMPVLYDNNHVLTSKEDKYGFISVKGYVSVPFIYDQIVERDDSLFDVRIDNRWGVIDVTGKVIVSIKYSCQVSSSFDNCLVTDALSESLGVLDSEGREKVPTVYDHLMIEDRLIYCGYGGYENDSSDNSSHNFFSGDIDGASWGVITKEGVPIIDPIYDCFLEKDGYIMAGRDGSFLGEGQHGFSYRESEYGGVYDLYDYEGTLLLGGFNKFFKDEKHGLLYFHFGGNWEQECEDYDEWGNAIYYYRYHFNEGNGRWLVTDKNLTSIIPKENGNSFTFRKGAKCTITRKEEDGKITNYWSFPLEQLSVIKPVYCKGLFIIGDEKQQRIVRYKDRACSLPYAKVGIINQDLFFIYEKGDGYAGIGISSFEGKIVRCEEAYSLLTKPVSGNVFAIKSIDEDNYTVVFLNIEEPSQITTAIERIDYWDIAGLLREGKLQILANKEPSEVHRFQVRDTSVFDDSFISSHGVEQLEVPFDNKTQYWFSVHFDIGLGEDDDDDDFYDGGNDDDWDYRRETWDAMTDGMYGDMPDDFDGDYSFMGR